MKKARRLYVLALTLVIAMGMLFPAGAFASSGGTAADNGSGAAEQSTVRQDLPPAQQPQAQPMKNLSEEMAKVKGEAKKTDLEKDAVEADVDEAFRMQSIPDLYATEKLRCTNEALKFKENKEGEGLMVTGAPSDLNDAYFILEGDFVFGDNTVSRVRIDALAKSKINMTAEFYLDSAKSPFVSIPLNKQKGSKTWKWSGDVAKTVLEQNIQGTHAVSMKITTDSEAKEVSVLLRGFEFMMNDGLPTVYLDIDESIQTISAMNNDQEHNTECYGNMTLQIPEGYQSEYGEEATAKTTSKTYEMEYIRGRGNSTWTADKKPYKIKLAKKADLLDMGKNKHWVLLANRFDNSFLRNKITYWMGDKLGMEFTPQSEYVDVFMNGEYLGIYCLCEQIRVGESRVEIDDLEDDETPGDGVEATEEPQITGGYLLGMSPYEEDWIAHPEQMFGTERSHRFEIESPEFDNHTENAQKAQYNYIKDYVQKTENAIYGRDFCDEDGNSWEDYLDKESAINYYWFQEVSKNGDAYGSTSTYMYKKRDSEQEKGKLFFGPLWDFDYVAWGDLEYSDPPNVEGFSQNTSFWFGRLLANETFAKEMREGYGRISELLKAAPEQLDKYADKIRTADYYEREKWGAYVENYDEEEEPVEASFQEEVNLLKNWITACDQWITENLEDLKTPVVTVTFKVDGKVVGTEIVEQGDYVENIPDPGTKKGKVFAGWYMDYDGFSYRADFTYPPYDDMILSAKWVDKSKDVKVKKIYFLDESMAIDTMFEYLEREPVVLPVQVVPFNATQQNLTWTSSDPSILKVNPKTGVCQLIDQGTVTVTAEAASGKKATCSVIVRGLDDESDFEYNLKTDKIVVYKGDYAKVELDGGDNPIAVNCADFNCDDSRIIEMGNCGVFKALKAGKTKVTVEGSYVEDDLVCTIIVKDKETKGSAVTRNGLKYTITKSWIKKAKAGKVRVKGFAGKGKKTVKIPASIKINGHTYKVTAVAAGAFKGKKMVRSVTFGKNIRTVGAKAFYKCKKLKKVTFTGKTISKIGKNAFKGIAKKAKFTVPSTGAKAYRKCLKKSAGITKSMRIQAKKISYEKL